MEPGSELKSKLGVLSSVVPCGAEVIVASGPTVSTVKLLGGDRAGVAGLVGGAHPEGVGAVGEPRRVEGAGAGAKRGGAGSSEHWKVEPGSELKSKLGVLSAVVPCGAEVIVAVGATVSTVKSSVATGPVLPAWSVARTRKV